jgi:hypothetical protein
VGCGAVKREMAGRPKKQKLSFPLRAAASPTAHRPPPSTMPLRASARRRRPLALLLLVVPSFSAALSPPLPRSALDSLVESALEVRELREAIERADDAMAEVAQEVSERGLLVRAEFDERMRDLRRAEAGTMEKVGRAEAAMLELITRTAAAQSARSARKLVAAAAMALVFLALVLTGGIVFLRTPDRVRRLTNWV